MLLVYLYLKQNNLEKAIEVNNKIIDENPNTSLSVRAKLNNFYIALYSDNNLTKAASLLNEAKIQSDLSTPIEIAPAEDAYNVHGNVIASSLNVQMPKIQKSNEELKPTSYSLLQNFPNPFNPTTVIRYDISKDGFVTLKVYDILGREVMTLVNENKLQGKYSVNFDASNIASGVYFYQLKAGSYTATKKLLLLK